MYGTNLRLTNDLNFTTENSLNSQTYPEEYGVMQILQLIIATVGVTTNLTVIVVFLNNKELRRKIPNRFIVNQIS